MMKIGKVCFHQVTVAVAALKTDFQYFESGEIQIDVVPKEFCFPCRKCFVADKM